MILSEMIKAEIDGKSAAVGAYDRIIWKIRTAYAIAAYGGMGAFVSLAENIGDLGVVHGAALMMVIVGLTFFFAAIDYGFVRSKLRVVEARDELIALAVKLSLAELNPRQCRNEITALLQNAGERTTRVDWGSKSARQPLLILYGGALVVAISTVILVTAYI
jgi:hypothetical protein